MKHIKIAFHPFKNNVLDYVDREAFLFTPNRRPVTIRRPMNKFVITIGNEPSFETDDNIVASGYLDRYDVGYFQ